MSLSKPTVIAVAVAALGFAAGLAVASSQPAKLGDLANNEGILVSVKTFSIVKGQAKGDPSAVIVKTGARQVAEGAIIYRNADKLYLIDGDPTGRPQAMNPGDPMPTTIDGYRSLFENF